MEDFGLNAPSSETNKIDTIENFVTKQMMCSEFWGYWTCKTQEFANRRVELWLWTRCRRLAGGSRVVHPAGPPYHCATLITIFTYTNQLNKASTIYWMYFCLALLVGLARFTAVLNYVNYCKMCSSRTCLLKRAVTVFTCTVQVNRKYGKYT